MDTQYNLRAHRAPIPEEVPPLPGDTPTPEQDPVPHPDPVIREPGEQAPPQILDIGS